MNTVFIGGSRRISRLSEQVQERLHKVTSSGAHVIVGDANGADKAVQKFLLDNAYQNVTVFCSGDFCRNNLGHWETQSISASDQAKGFDFYAAKDRAMAHNADFGLMIWDGKSVGTILNILRLVRAGKKAVLLNVPKKAATTFKAAPDWENFISQLNANLRDDLRKRATPDEWMAPHFPQQPGLSEEPELFTYADRNATSPAKSEDDIAAEINAALATGDPTRVVDVLGSVAKARGMSQVAKEAGLARESLYRALSSGGNPEFTTVLKVIAALGLRLLVRKLSDRMQNERP
jgi:probable addiction module antidote protein